MPKLKLFEDIIFVKCLYGGVVLFQVLAKHSNDVFLPQSDIRVHLCYCMVNAQQKKFACSYRNNLEMQCNSPYMPD